MLTAISFYFSPLNSLPNGWSCHKNDFNLFFLTNRNYLLQKRRYMWLSLNDKSWQSLPIRFYSFVTSVWIPNRSFKAAQIELLLLLGLRSISRRQYCPWELDETPANPIGWKWENGTITAEIWENSRQWSRRSSLAYLRIDDLIKYSC